MDDLGERARQLIHTLCSFGPRPTGSVALARLRAFLHQSLRALGLSTREQTFSVTPNSQPGAVQTGVNLIASIRPEQPNRLLLGTHYDTRPIADEDPDPARRSEPILGANDGASGVALLMEMARTLAETPPSLGIDFVFFDAEEYVLDPNQDDLLLGSTHFAQQITPDDYRAAVVVDIVARPDMILTPDSISWNEAHELVSQIWEIGHNLYPEYFVNIPRYEIHDDHLPLLEAGLPAAVLIDTNDPHWHTHDDRPEFCAAQPLQAVGRVLLEWIRTQEQPLPD